MKKSEFKKIEEEYYRRRRKLINVFAGDLVWEGVSREINMDYHPAVVKGVSVNGDYIEVIDVSDGNKERQLENFLTETEFMVVSGVSIEMINEEREKYAGIINQVKTYRGFSTTQLNEQYRTA